jgi:hypothetical protein
MVVTQFQVALTGADQVFQLKSSGPLFHKIFMTFGTVPTAGTVTIEKREFGSDRWFAIPGAQGASVTAGQVVFDADGTLAALRVTFADVAGGAAPVLTVTSKDTAWSPPQTYPVLTPIFGEVLPTANGSFTTTMMSPNNGAQVYAEFFSDSAGTKPATPTAGTLTVQASPMGNNWLAPGNAGVVSATTCGTTDSTYTPPLFQGHVSRGRVTFAGVTGAPFARVVFWSF